MKNLFKKKGLGTFILLLGVFGAQAQQAQVTFEVTKFPANTPAKDTLFLTGNLNNWNPSDKTLAFQKGPKNHLYLTLPAGNGVLEYKVTRGSWAKGEALASGAPRTNRAYTSSGKADTVKLEIESWEDNFAKAAKAHTASPSVQVVSNVFYMPQLQKNRRVWIYLPAGYDSSRKKYTVLYMHDGQNVFDAYYSYSGEWGVDEALDSLAKKQGPEVIVIGVDNGGEERMNEYTPWKNAKYGGGKGDAYVDFLAQTLKPYIDTHYRTLSDKANTGIAGSSMGGLISLYATLKYPNVFGKAGVFSPAFWVSPEFFDFVGSNKPSKDVKIYLVAGAKEGEQMVPDMARMRDLLIKKGIPSKNLKYAVHADGEHKEGFWRREFPGVFAWLFRK
jgi:predicted alpha/beta superfamily hydrolase